jgi:hypothetical protein
VLLKYPGGENVPNHSMGVDSRNSRIVQASFVCVRHSRAERLTDSVDWLLVFCGKNNRLNCLKVSAFSFGDLDQLTARLFQDQLFV